MASETIATTAPVSDREFISNNQEYTLVDILILLAKRRTLVFASTIVAAVAAIILALVLPSSFTATVTVLPPRSESSLSSTLMSQMAGSFGALLGGNLNSQDPTETFMGLLRSRTVEDAVVSRFALDKVYGAKRASDSRAALEGHCEIKRGTKDGLVSVAITDRDPQRAANIANGYMEEYKKFSSHLAITEAGQRRLFFEQQLEEAKENLANSEEAFRAYEQKGGLLQLDSQTRLLVESFAQLRAQITAKNVEIQAMQSYASANNPDLIRAQRQLAALQSQARQLTGKYTGDENDIIVSRGNLPAAGLEYIRKYRDVKYYESIFELLAKQYELAKLDEARQGAVLQIVDPAVVPDRRSAPRRTLIVAICTLIGFFGSMFFVILAEAVAHSPEIRKLRGLKRVLWKR